jgi:hypothetical protein
MFAQDVETPNAVEELIEQQTAPDTTTLEFGENVSNRTKIALRSARRLELRTVDSVIWSKDTMASDYHYTVRPKVVAQPEQTSKPKSSRSFAFDAQASRVVVSVLATVLVLVILYLLVGDKLLSRRPLAPKLVDPPDWESVETYTEWEAAVAAAEAGGDFRLAIRILYLQTLKLLDTGGVISYNKETSNASYLAKLMPTNHGILFRELLRYFNYTWFGSYVVSRTGYQAVKLKFLDFHQSIV